MIQKIIDLLYRKPKSEFKTYRRFGGFFNYQNMLREQEKMKKAVVNLVPMNSYKDGLEIYFLTGDKYLYQTLFCIQSLVKFSNDKFKFILVDDGTFSSQLITEIDHYVKGCTVVTSNDININLERVIPEKDFPYLHHKRKVYPHIKKLTDIHTISPGSWKLILDSDMLFWGNPTEIISWLKNPTHFLCMKDTMESYGYSKKAMEELCGLPIPELVNVGVVGVNSSSIDWRVIEDWSKTLEEREGTSYYLEQALTAMLFAGKPLKILSAEKYVVYPGKTEIKDKKGLLHHYVDLSKEGYYKTAWKNFI